MATLVLGAVGAAVGGPVGRAVGAVFGTVADRLLLGGGARARQGARLADLSVQGSDYGAGLPRIYGTMRVAGQVIWSTGLVETARTSGGGKKSGGRTTTYSYSASFAVALAGRRVEAMGRIWADGKLLRSSAGEMLSAGTFRLHSGGEDQEVDPLIASAEGVDATPAYRGLAYAVFEDLQLGDFANRVPNLTFELIADAAPPDLGAVVTDLCEAAGTEPPTGTLGASLPGLAIGAGGSVRSAAEMVAAVIPVRMRADGVGLGFGGDDAGWLPADAVARTARHEVRGAADGLPGEVAVAFLDVGRDYQSGLQRARRGGSARRDATEIPAAMTASAAKQLAETMLANAWSRRVRATAALGWRQAAIQPGDLLRDTDGRRWRVRRWTMEGLGVSLELERVDGAARPSLPPSDGGRANSQVDAAQGETLLHVLDLPPLPGQPLPVTPRLWLAAGGTGAGWRRAEVMSSLDGGVTWQSVAVVGGPSAIGTTMGILAPGPCERWDRRGSIEVELLNDAMWLESRTEASVLAGANLALIGDELVAFARAEATGPRRFRLSLLLRGRQGSEGVSGGHVSGERFILLLPDMLTPVDPPLGAVGGRLLFKAVAPNELSSAAAAIEVPLVGRALRPLSPVGLRASRDASGDIRLTWVRRSRQGFDWLDGVDAPVAEERERYVVHLGGVRSVECDAPALIYAAADQIADTGALVTSLEVAVAQISATVGSGPPATAILAVP